MKSLADRFAEGFAETLHLLIRKEYWGYAEDENLDGEALIREKYQGTCPAPGYPACPDHTEKPTLFKLLDAKKKAGVWLTENNAMYSASSVSGFYFANKAAKYFPVGKMEKDQIEDYAKRKGMKVEDVEKWLAPNLAYNP